MSEGRRIYCHSTLQAQPGQGSDQAFRLNLGSFYSVEQRILLDSFSVDNYFCNFYNSYGDFSYQVEEQPVTVLICDQYVPYD